jgi:hypothetical protein
MLLRVLEGVTERLAALVVDWRKNLDEFATKSSAG